jgi:Nucleotide-sugar transporter
MLITSVRGPVVRLRWVTTDEIAYTAKGFATSLSIILSFAASVALFNYHLTLGVLFGSSLVIAATFLFDSRLTWAAVKARAGGNGNCGAQVLSISTASGREYVALSTGNGPLPSPK